MLFRRFFFRGNLHIIWWLRFLLRNRLIIFGKGLPVYGSWNEFFYSLSTEHTHVSLAMRSYTTICLNCFNKFSTKKNCWCSSTFTNCLVLRMRVKLVEPILLLNKANSVQTRPSCRAKGLVVGNVTARRGSCNAAPFLSSWCAATQNFTTREHAN